MEPLIRATAMIDLPFFSLDYHQYDILVSKKRPYMSATLDGELTVARENPWDFPIGTKGILEVKTGSMSPNFENAWLGVDRRTPAIPSHYLAQACHQLSVTGWDFVIFATRLRRRAMFEEDMGFPEIASFYRIVDRRGSVVRACIESVENASESFYERLESRERPPRALAL